MTAFDYLDGIRRRFAVVLACVLVALVAGWLTTEAKPPPPDASRPALWSATSIIIGTSDAAPGLGSITTLAALTKVGEVPARVAEALGRKETGSLTGAISAVADPETALLTISSRADTRQEAEALANEFARQLVGFQRESVADERDLAFGSAVRILQRAQAYPGEPVLTASGSLSATDDETARRRAQLYVVPADVDAEDEQVKKLLEEGTSWRVPPRHPVRLAVSGGTGLILGIAVALLLSHYDTRILSKPGAEGHVSWPVLGEIPSVKSRRMRVAGTLLSASSDSATGYAFRLLVAALGAPPQRSVPPGVPEPAPPRVIMVTSPERGDGKTTVAVNLAAGFAEAGRRVLLLSCDFRNPGVDKVVQVTGQRGLVDVLDAASSEPVLEAATQTLTSGKVNLGVVPTGSPPARPARLLRSQAMRRILAEARATAEVVVIDTAPLTTTSDAAALTPYVDAVLLVLRAGKTTGERTRAADELLGRLGAPVAGVVVNRVSRPSSQRRGRRRARQAAPGAERSGGYPRLARHSEGT